MMNITFFSCEACGATNCADSDSWKLKKFDSESNTFLDMPENKCTCGAEIESIESLMVRSTDSGVALYEKEKKDRERNCECDATMTMISQSKKHYHRAVNRDALKVKKASRIKEADDIRISTNVELAKAQDEARKKAQDEARKKAQDEANGGFEK